MSDESAIERFSRRGRRVLFAIFLIVVVVAGGGLWISLEFGPLRAVAYVIATSALAGFLFPRLV